MDDDEMGLDRKPSAAVAVRGLAEASSSLEMRDNNIDVDVDEDDDDDDDADNWSRRVETDESAPAAASLLLMQLDDEASASFRVESVTEERSGRVGGMAPQDVNDSDNLLVGDISVQGGTSSAVLEEEMPPPPPSHPELTLKERLVMRERQRRIETERARLKRQFLAANGGGGGGEDVGGGVDERSSSSIVRPGSAGAALRGVGADESAGGSVTEEGTLGEESTRAHADHDDSRDQLGFNMERFLRGSESFNPSLETMAEEDRPIVMERFLNGPVVVVDHSDANRAADGVATSLIVGEVGVGRSFQEDDDDDIVLASESGLVPDNGEPSNVPAESFVSYGDETNVSTNASVHVEADDDDVARDPLTPMASMDVPDAGSDNDEDQPRVLRLTEADMQEMAAIEEASIGNAPPSEREDEELSEIAELADFATGPGHIGRSRQGTPTTAVESASLHSAGNHSIPHASSTEEKPGSDTFVGEAEGAAHRPASLPGTPVRLVGGDVVVNHLYSDPPLLADESMASRMSPTVAQGGLEGDDQVSPLLVNRVLRPGMVKMRPHHHHLAARGDDPPMLAPVVVDGFDFDKNAPASPPMSGHRHDDSFGDLPPDAWSPAGKMHVSPISYKPSGLGSTMMEEGPTLPFAVADAQNDPRRFREPVSPLRESHEGTPLLRGDIPPEVITSAPPSEEFRESSRSFRSTRRFSMVSIGSIFSDVRSEEDVSREEIQNESEVYLASSILSRAFPERMFALTVTLIFEIPVLLMISGGSDALCQLVGRRRYQLLMGFIPLTSAISGNVGLQASTLTTRAISHTHVTPTNYIPWFMNEIGAACVLGMGMGLLLGSIAFYASGLDFAFGFTIMFAQFISIVTAGCTGTFAPLLFSFIFRRDSGKWGGPLETAIQDIVGSFAMVIISYHILKFLGPGPVSPDDVCSTAPTDDLA